MTLGFRNMSFHIWAQNVTTQKFYINRICCDEMYTYTTHCMNIGMLSIARYRGNCISCELRNKRLKTWTIERRGLSWTRVLTTKKHKDFLSQSLMCVQFISISIHHPNAFKFYMQYSKANILEQKWIWSNFCLGHLVCMHITIYAQAHHTYS